MYIHLETVTLQGVTCTCHRLVKTEIKDTGASAVVSSFANDTSEMIVWQDAHDIPLTAFADASDPITAVINYLSGSTGPFSGGALISDPSELDQLKARANANINAKRAQVANGVCTTPSGIVDCDITAKSNILGAVSAAIQAQMAGTTFSINWRLHDNTDVALDALGMMAVGNAVLAFVEACYANSWALKASVEAAETVDDLNAIDISAGWPE